MIYPSEEEIKEFKKILNSIKKCLLLGDLEQVVDSYFILDEDQTYEGIIERLRLNLEDYLPLIEFGLTLEKGLRLPPDGGVIFQFRQKVENFSASDCFFMKSGRISPFGESDRIKLERYSKSNDVVAFKAVVRLDSEPENPQLTKFEEFFGDMYPIGTWQWDYTKSNLTTYVVYFEDEEEYENIESYFRDMLPEFDCKMSSIIKANVGTAEWTDIKKQFEY